MKDLEMRNLISGKEFSIDIKKYFKTEKNKFISLSLESKISIRVCFSRITN